MGKPTIRFEGYTDDWEQRKVSEIVTEKLSNGIMNNQVSNETGLRHINVINMYDTDKIHPEKLTFSGHDEEVVKKCNVEKGDIFLTRSSLKPEGIAEANVLLDSGRFVYDDHLIRLKVDKEKYDSFFVKLNLSGSDFKRQFLVRAKTTAFTTIGQEDIIECSGFFPVKEEQKKIGFYFDQLDHLITLHQRKCEETKKLKKFMLQKMFPQKGEKVPKIRFDGFTDDWEQRKLEDIIEKLTGGASIAPDDYVDAGYRTIPKGAVNSSGIADMSGCKIVSEDFFKKNISSKTSSGELVTSLRDLVSTAPNMGRIVRICGDYEDFLMPQGVYSIIVKKKISEDFLIAYSNSPEYRKIIMAEKNGSTQVHIRNGEFLNIDIPLPSYEEQMKIGKQFNYLDHLITLHQRKCEELQNIKKFMLQNMFV